MGKNGKNRHRLGGIYFLFVSWRAGIEGHATIQGVQYALIIASVVAGIFTGCAGLLIFARNLRSVRGEIVTSSAPVPDTRLDGLVDKIRHLEDTVAAVARRPEVTEYREVLLRLEKAESAVRTNELRLGETMESLKRTANKLAARSSRAERKVAEAVEPPEEEEEPVLLPPPAASMNGHQPQGRRFGRLS